MRHGSICAALAMTMVGSSVAVMGLLRGFPVYSGQALRFAVAAILLGGTLRLQGRRTGGTRPVVSGRQWLRIGMLAAIGMVAFNVAVAAAERHTDPALVGVIVGCAPVVIALVIPLLARARPSGRMVLSGAVVTAGAALAQGLGSGGSPLGLLFAVGALAGEVGFALIAAPLLGPLGALRVSTLACATAVPLCAVGAIVTGEFALPDARQLLAVLWLGVVVTACAYVLWFSAIAAIGAQRAGLFTGLVPISAVAVTALIGTGRPTWANLAGAVLVLAGLLTGLTAGSEPKSTVVSEDRTDASQI